jgi:type I restriction enzyme S subunit
VSLIVRVPCLADLGRWDVKHLLGRRWLRADDQLEPFGAVATRREERHQGDARFGSIHFDGSISLRDPSTKLSGSTWVAHPGDVVFSKIDARNGAIAVVPEAMGTIAFSNEFPIYDVDENRLTPDFARLLLSTRVLRSQVDALAVGHSGRKRVPPEVFEMLTIPVPRLDEQRRIVADYETAMAAAAAVTSRAEPLIASAANQILMALGVDYSRLRHPPLAFAVPFSALPRWSARKGAEIIQGVTREIAADYPVVRLGDVATLRRGLSKSPENRPGEHATPYVRVANIQPGFLDLCDVQQLNVLPDQVDGVRLLDGDVLVCRNNSLDWVGKAALWSGEIDPCVHDDHVFSVRSDPSALEPAFLNAYLQTDLARSWFISEAQITTNLAGIAGSAVNELPIPLPPLETQRMLGSQFEQDRTDAAAFYAEGAAREESARDLAEWEIVTGGSLPQ